MREFKIFVIVAFIIGVIYYGVEPLAHHAMHPETAESDYEFRDLDKFGKFDFSNADIDLGKEAFVANCTSCHTLNSQAEPDFHMRNPKTIQPAGNGGVVPPDLSNSGLIFDSNFLAHFIKDPVRAVSLEAKFAVSCDGLDEEQTQICELRNEGKESYPMNAFNGIMTDEDIVNVVAFLKSIAPNHINDKEVFLEACNRCHAIDYDKGQYDSKFYAESNHIAHSMLERIEKDGEEIFLNSLNDEDKRFIDEALAIAKVNEKSQLTEDELNDKNDSISQKTIEDYGVTTILQQVLKESKFGVGIHAITDKEQIKGYLGNYAPDLSMMIRAKGAHELAAFINNPQKVPLIDIQKSIINGLLQEKRKLDKNKFLEDNPNVSDGEKEKEFEQIDLRDAQYYKISLPDNNLRSKWQKDNDYTNIAKDLGFMPFGKSMPRVGLTKNAEEQVINYLETIGDSNKTQRDSLGLWIIGFFVLLSILAYMWKSKIWRDLH